MKTKKFIYEGRERNILVIEENDQDIFGFDLNLLPEDVKEKLNASYRHFKKQKIKTNNNVEKIEEKQKKFSI
jgi:hypothetical protein